MRRFAACFSVVTVVIFALCARGLFAADLDVMASGLCRSGGGDWSRVVRVVVSGAGASDLHRVISAPIKGNYASQEKGAFPFVGERVESLRVCDAEGAELLFNVRDASGKILYKGAIPEGATLSFPANAPAGDASEFYVFAGNDKAFLNLDALMDFRREATNLDFETGAGDVPDGWAFDAPDDDHRMNWVEETPRSGKKCVRCDVAPDAEPTWIAARQANVALEPGGKYRFTGWIRGQKITGGAGWYLHIGDQSNAMRESPMLYVGKEGDFDWTRLSKEFTVAENCDRLEFGTVLRGTGVAWFDHAQLERLDAATDSQRIVIDAVQNLDVPASVEAPRDAIPSDARIAKLRVEPTDGGERLVAVNLATIEARWGRTFAPGDFEIVGLDGKPLTPEVFGGVAYCVVKLRPATRSYLWLVEKNGGTAVIASTSRGIQSGAAQAFPGTMLQTNAEDAANSSQNADAQDALKLPKFIAARNLLSDGGFEDADADTLAVPAGKDGFAWSHDADEPGVDYSFVDPGVPELGKKALRVEVAPEAPQRWRGWRRRVRVEPNQTYLFGYAIRTDSTGGSYDMHLHWRKDDGSLAKSGFDSLGRPTSGKTPWTLKCAVRHSSEDATIAEIHLTNQTYGTSEYDSVFVLPVDSAGVESLEGGEKGVFQVPAVAKVFPDTTFSKGLPELTAARPATSALALDEEETLQIAIRPDVKQQGEYRVAAPAPKLKGDASKTLDAPDVFVVSNVLVDYPTNYYHDEKDATFRKFPKSSPACDGWIGYWPDPLIPLETASPSNARRDAAAREFGAPEQWNDSQKVSADAFAGVLSLRADETRAIWLRFKTTPETAPGVYEGHVSLVRDDGVTLDVPYATTVLNFVAPSTRITGIYDSRISHDYFGEGTRREKLVHVSEKLLERKLCPDKPVCEPKISYDKETGRATADWSEYDAEATRYFDELGGKAAYFPGEFYLFGWGVPPKVVEGENPYPGEWPYDGADRATLRPEYKKAYQAKLKLFWDHLKEKGWADKCVLYISDEPFYSKPEIIEQMKALCDMIHEVDPAIPIYSSTWVFVPEWLGYIDVWGVGHYGGVGEETLQKIFDAGGRVWWTTDGQMCLDTPLCAVERLLPYTCVRRGAELYEFWGATWYTCNPFDSASHFYISQSDQPGVRYWVRYPNGDGYIFYPGEPIGRPGAILDSVRSEQAREGVEDAGWLVGLRDAIATKTNVDSAERAEAQTILDRALDWLPLNCGSGRYSTRYIADPQEFERVRLDVGLELEKLLKL